MRNKKPFGILISISKGLVNEFLSILEVNNFNYP